MSFQTGLSGLNSAAKNLEVIGNNVANANVTGFKGARAQFADVYAASLSGGGSTNAVGIGTRVAAVAQDFTQGTISVTNNPLDVAISGNGFFRMTENGVITYSRNGEFQLDSQGFIVNALGHNLTGYGVDATGAVVASQPVPLRIVSADVPPTPTSEYRAVFNLRGNNTPITQPFNPANPATFTETIPANIFDSLGNSHVLQIYFARTANAGEYAVYGTVDGSPVPNVTGLPATIQFDSNGQLTTPMPVNGVSLPITGGATSPLAISFDLFGSTQFGQTFGLSSLFQNGATSGKLAGFAIAPDGTITGRYTNTETRTLGQIVLSSFINPQGLTPLGGGQYAETSSSGLPITGAPLTGTLGALQSAAREDGNVDLTKALVDLITAQRNYQANAQTIKTQDAVLQTLVNLR